MSKKNLSIFSLFYLVIRKYCINENKLKIFNPFILRRLIDVKRDFIGSIEDGLRISKRRIEGILTDFFALSLLVYT